MPAFVRLKYKDDEGLVVLVDQNYADEGLAYLIEVARDHEHGTQIITVVFTNTLKHAQVLARLLVGIEIQPDGAAWRRGPRPPAMPTDASGRIIYEEGGV